jgi:putative phosphoribosyl transferase
LYFHDRRDAGRRLAEALSEYGHTHPLVIALPRGGVTVGAEVALALGAPLDLYVVRKIAVPQDPELGMGAVTEDGTLVIDQDTASLFAVTGDELGGIVRGERATAEARARRLRQDRPLSSVEGRTVILVDDGLATGVTARAAVRGLRKRGPAGLVLAVPIAAAPTAEELADEVEDLVVLERPVELGAIGLWYLDFRQVSDEEVAAAVLQARARGGEAGAPAG